MTTAANFTSIPTLYYDLLASPDTRPAFIQQLQNALINIGFLYLEHPPIPSALFDEVVAYLPRFFALPKERKDALRMANSPHFLGYSHLGVERTRGTADQREQFDLATPLKNGNSRWTPGEPEYLRLWGPSQVSSYVLLCPCVCLPAPGVLGLRSENNNKKTCLTDVCYRMTIACFPARIECVVAGRGGRAGFQDRVREVPGSRRESELRVCAARGGGTRARARRTRAVFRRTRAHAAPCKGTARHTHPLDHEAAARQGGQSLAGSLHLPDRQVPDPRRGLV